jgi:prophage tail gpP-like protein
MPQHPVNTDRFRLLVAGQDVPIASNYTVQAGVFEVPGTFDMTVGHTGLLRELVDAYCEHTPFELYVNDVRVMVGEIDELTGVGREGTELKISGRDNLARLVDCKIKSDREFKESTFTDLVEAALADVGLGDVSVVSSNLANRKAITGKYKVEELVPQSEESTETTLANTVQTRTKMVHNSLVMQAGTTWWEFLQPQFQRGGLFLWADVFGGFVLGQPNGKQAPSTRIHRRRTGRGEQGDVTILGQPDWSRSTRQRYSEFHVLGRKGTGANGRGKAESKKFDEEMIALLNPNPADRANGGKRTKLQPYTDDKVKTPEQAAFLCLRKIAESRRNSFHLTYKVSGHTAPAMSGGGSIVWQPDIVVHVVDDELGIDEPMYVEDCKYGRTPDSWTQVKLLRCEDLIFGEEDLLAPPPRPKKSLLRIGRTEVFRPKWVKDPNWGGLPTLRTVRLADDPSVSNRSQTPNSSADFVVDEGAERRP